MSVTMTVSQVRDALYLAEETSNRPDDSVSMTLVGDGRPTTAVLGQWFHQALSWLVSNEDSEGPLNTLKDVEADLETWKSTLIRQVYDQFVGPRLTQNQVALQGSAQQVQDFWEAMQSATCWLAELCWSLRPTKLTRQSYQLTPWHSLSELVQTDEPLVCEFYEPGWTDRVRLVGIADAIVRLEETNVWCVVEFKSGKTSPAADLGQVCLYHMILSAMNKFQKEPEREVGDIALLSFKPHKEERFFTHAELAETRQKLLDLIGQLAGVSQRKPTISPTTKSEPIPAIQSTSEVSTNRTGIIEDEKHLKIGQLMIQTFSEYGVNVTLDHPIIAGPSFLRFSILLGKKTKVAQVEKLAPELQVRLKLDEQPFISTDGGELVIDVRRPDRLIVHFDDIRSQLPQAVPGVPQTKVPVGVNLSGELVFADLSCPEHSHILVAGTTGSGKSEWLRTAIAGLIVTNTPETLRLLIIDPKRNAFHALRDSPFLMQPLIFPDETSVVEVFEKLCEEMDERYKKLDGADNIAELTADHQLSIPRIVCVCDEYRDLISRSSKERKEIEALIFRLGAKSRAAGIHLILATQQPSRETIKGALDSNMAARVGLKMNKSQESHMLFSEGGAEKLLGHGDLLFKDIGSPRRLQAPLLSKENHQQIFGAK